MIRSTLIAVGLFAHLSAAETLLVPEQYTNVSDAINSSSPDDLILVDSNHIDEGEWPLPHNLRISGNSAEEKFLVIATNDLFSVSESPHEIHLENIEIQADAQIQGSGKISISNCVFDGTSTQIQGNLFDTCGSIVIEDSTFKNFVRAPFSKSSLMGASDSCNFSVSNCLFERCHGGIGAGAIGISPLSFDGIVNISDCHFIDCSSSNYRGGAISIEGTGSGICRISNNIFTGCSAPKGGAIYVGDGGLGAGSAPEITNCVFIENIAFGNPGGGGVLGGGGSADGAGGAIWATTRPMTIAGCEFVRNVATGFGGGLYHEGPSNSVFASGCRFEQNSGSIGGGVSGSITIDLCSFCENTPSALGPDVVVGNSNTFDESCGSCCIGGGCIPSSQQVCTDSGGTYVAAGCADASCPSPIGSCCNQGSCVESTMTSCFEAGGSFAGFGTSCTGIECPTVCEGDITGNGDVGLTDLIAVLSNWGPCPG